MRQSKSTAGHSAARHPDVFALALAAIFAFAAPEFLKHYDPGASDTEIKIGNIMSYTGWAEQYGAIGRAEAAYFQMINDRGGEDSHRDPLPEHHGGARSAGNSRPAESSRR